MKPLPKNIHLLTLEKWGDHVLLRLEHLFELGEDKLLSKAVKISLKVREQEMRPSFSMKVAFDCFATLSRASSDDRAYGRNAMTSYVM